jgi:ribosomal protein S18 acetylase RimI-like enzyme
VTQVRAAVRSDLREIARLHRDASAIRRDLDPLLTTDEGDSRRIGNDFRSMLRRRSCRIVVAGVGASGELGGYAVGTVVHNEPFSVSRYGYINCLSVGQERRCHGTGDALLEAMRNWFKEKGLAAAQVDVSRSAPEAQGFLERRGFRPFLDHLSRGAGREIDGSGVPCCTIRQAEAADTDSVVLLWKEMMDVHSAIDERLSVASTWREIVASSIKRWLRDRDSCLIVAERAEEVIGFALGGVVHPTLGLEPYMHGQIAHLCVGARWRRRGVGRQLVRSLVEWLADRHVHSIHLYVSRFNPGSQRFWRTLGYGEHVSRLWCDLV